MSSNDCTDPRDARPLPPTIHNGLRQADRGRCRSPHPRAPAEPSQAQQSQHLVDRYVEVSTEVPLGLRRVNICSNVSARVK